MYRWRFDLFLCAQDDVCSNVKLFNENFFYFDAVLIVMSCHMINLYSCIIIPPQTVFVYCFDVRACVCLSVSSVLFP